MALGHEKLRPYGLIDCDSLLSHLRTGRLGTGKILTRHFRSILGAMEGGDLGDVERIPGNENPADGLTKAKSDLGAAISFSGNGYLSTGAFGTAARCVAY